MGRQLKGCGTTAAYQRGCRCSDCRAANNARCGEQREKRIARLASAEINHGALAYSNWGCRCEVCSEAWSEKMKRERKDREKRVQSADEGVPHGTRSGYTSWGCRCKSCRAVAAEWERRPDIRARRTAWDHQWRERPGIREKLNEARKRWEQKDPANLAYVRNQQVASKARLVARLADSATRRGYEWTGPELEIASREDLTTSEVAKMLGRTYYAVVNKRRALKVDPRAMTMASVEAPPPPPVIFGAEAAAALGKYERARR